MKRFIRLSVILLFCFLEANAQGVNQLWGMTQMGGGDNLGVVFSTSASGNNFRLRNQFNYTSAGFRPRYTVPVAYNGKFYGMTSAGGINNRGVIFEWDPVTNIYTKKYDFNSTNGWTPYGSLTLSGTKFYGMTWEGGVNNGGVIFEWDPATNIYTKRIDLTFATGSAPYGNLTEYGGKFYGMTYEGGANNFGVIFEWDPVTNIYTKKIDLSIPNGISPLGSLTLNSGKLYGMTQYGGVNDQGVIFEWDPVTNIYTKKIDLVYANGAIPAGNSLVFSGSKFYGMTTYGGSSGVGVIFEWDPVTNIYTKRYDLTPAGGRNPNGNLTVSGTKLYGMTYAGGNSNLGAIFEWDPVTNVYSKRIDLTSVTGYRPYGSLVLSGSRLFGMTNEGGFTSAGVIFEWDPATNIHTKKIDFNAGIDGKIPYSNLALSNGKLYGTTNQGGVNNVGVIFEWDPATNTFTKKLDLDFAGGCSPENGSLILYGTKFYGMAPSGGSNLGGVIFEWDPVTNTYTKKIELTTNSSNGSNPRGGLTLSGGKFYGMTYIGGINGYGVIFEWDPATNIYTKKIDLDFANGVRPYGNLTFYGGKFYGMTNLGGANSGGVIFEWDPVTNIYTKKYDFTSVSGTSPYGNLTAHGTKLYGMTYTGGSNGLGVIFEWDPATNVYTKRIDLSNAAGCIPQGDLTLNNGKFYGLTLSGGTNGLGVIFEWDPITNVYTKKKDFTGPDGQAPLFANGLIIVPAPVAKGNLTSCEALPTITIDATNNNVWVPIVDNLGDIAAEINANGNNLGIVSTSLYTKNGACREDGSNRLYLNRNITITPQTQPGSGNVSVRLYIKKSELDSLRTAMNSMNQPSGVASINEVDVFKNNDACSTVGSLTALPLTATTGTYNSDYYLQVSISSFSSFYFANKLLTAILPVKIKSFTGKRVGAANELKWEASCNSPVSFYVERSSDGSYFETIGNVAAADCNAPFYFTDNTPFSKNNYYRLRFTETGTTVKYSAVILLNADKTSPLLVSVQPNLVRGSSINIKLVADKNQAFELMITDVTGRMMLNRQLTAQAGINNETINVSSLASGIYWLHAVGKEGRSNVVRFVKQ